MSFADEIKNYTIEELELIVLSQNDLYSEDEMNQLKALLEEKIRIEKEEYEAKILARMPETINCEKCEAPNPSSNEVCEFCGCYLDKSVYYSEEYDDSDESEESEDEGKSYTFHYVISFLIPIVGLIIGAIMLTKDDEEQSSCGKTCIILSIVAVVISTVMVTISYLI